MTSPTTTTTTPSTRFPSSKVSIRQEVTKISMDSNELVRSQSPVIGASHKHVKIPGSPMCSQVVISQMTAAPPVSSPTSPSSSTTSSPKIGNPNGSSDGRTTKKTQQQMFEALVKWLQAIRSNLLLKVGELEDISPSSSFSSSSYKQQQHPHLPKKHEQTPYSTRRHQNHHEPQQQSASPSPPALSSLRSANLNLGVRQALTLPSNAYSSITSISNSSSQTSSYSYSSYSSYSSLPRGLEKRNRPWKTLWCALRGAAILCFESSPPPSEEARFVESTDQFPELSLNSSEAVTSPFPSPSNPSLHPHNHSSQVLGDQEQTEGGRGRGGENRLIKKGILQQDFVVEGIRLLYAIHLDETTILDGYGSLTAEGEGEGGEGEEKASEVLPGKRYLGCGFSVKNKEGVFRFCAPDEELQSAWLEQLQKTLVALYPDRSKTKVDETIFCRKEKSTRRVLDVIVEEAKDLRKEAGDEVYCNLFFGDYRACTSVTQQPQWKEDFTFIVNMKYVESPLRVIIMRRKNFLGTEEPLGLCKVFLSSLEDEDAHDGWFEMRSLDAASSSYAGTVRLKLHFTYTQKHVAMLDYLGTPSKVLPYRLDTGDLLLYTNNNVASLLGRLFTWSDWDHVAVVINNNPNDPKQSKKDISSSSSSLSSKQQTEGRLWVLEATLQVGVSMCDLDAQLEVVLRGGSEIGLRRLYCPQRYIEEDLARLWTFLKEVDGRPYKRNWLELVRASRVFGDEGNLKEDLSTLFCSQLCAAVYKVLGILPNNQRSNNFLPKDFASLFGVPLAKGASLDSKIRTPSKIINVTS